MYCKNCGEKLISEDTRYCTKCGARQTFNPSQKESKRFDDDYEEERGNVRTNKYYDDREVHLKDLYQSDTKKEDDELKKIVVEIKGCPDCHKPPMPPKPEACGFGVLTLIFSLVPFLGLILGLFGIHFGKGRINKRLCFIGVKINVVVIAVLALIFLWKANQPLVEDVCGEYFNF